MPRRAGLDEKEIDAMADGRASFYILDGWGLLVEPWISHSMKASIRKFQDHDIPMRFRLACPEARYFTLPGVSTSAAVR